MTTDLNQLPLDELFDRLVDSSALDALIARARLEDIDQIGDITGLCFIEPDRTAVARFVSRADGRLAGGRLLHRIAAAYDLALRVELHLPDGAPLAPGAHIATLTGPLRSIVAAERVMLNFMTHLSGVATLTDQYVRLIQDTHAGIYDTRKTIPGLRQLQKYAVRCGGGFCHRVGLFDAMLVKDNHIAHIPADRLAEVLATAIAAARARFPSLAFVQVEVDTLDQLRRVLPCDLDIILLDNMPPHILRDAVALRNELNPAVRLEASGGVNLQTVQSIARPGVDRISIGALTHSAPALDIGLDITPDAMTRPSATA